MSRRAQGERRVRDMLIYVLGCLDEAREAGLVEGGVRLCGKAVDDYHDLLASGFSPTEDEIRGVLAIIQSGAIEAAFAAEDQSQDQNQSVYARAMSILDLEREIAS